MIFCKFPTECANEKFLKISQDINKSLATLCLVILCISTFRYAFSLTEFCNKMWSIPTVRPLFDFDRHCTEYGPSCQITLSLSVEFSLINQSERIYVANESLNQIRISVRWRTIAHAIKHIFWPEMSLNEICREIILRCVVIILWRAASLPPSISLLQSSSVTWRVPDAAVAQPAMPLSVLSTLSREHVDVSVNRSWRYGSAKLAGVVRPWTQ